MAYDSLYTQYGTTQTTDNTVTTVATIPFNFTDSTSIIEVCMGLRSGSNAAQCKKRALIKNVSGTLTAVSVTTLDALAGDAGLLTASFTVDISGTNIRVRVTGIAATTIVWSPCIAFRAF